MTIPKHLEKQRDHYRYQYAQRLVSDKARYMDDFKLRARIYGSEWRDAIWALCKEINQERK